MATRRRICQIRVLAKNSPVLANSSTRQNGHFGKLAGLDTFARHSPTIFPGLDTFARHLPTISPDSIHSLTFHIRHLWEKCDSPRHIRASNSPFWRIWGEWPLLKFYSQNVKIPKLLNLSIVYINSLSLFIELIMTLAFCTPRVF